MAKKNKDIEVQINEVKKQVAGQTVTVNQLVIGKKVIGEVIPTTNQFGAWADGEKISTVKTLDAGVEAVIRAWNLHD